MRKRPTAQSEERRVSNFNGAKNRLEVNQALNTQTRKVLSKHYRAKHGVR